MIELTMETIMHIYFRKYLGIGLH